MKPRFALELSNDAISLLERGQDLWTRIGKADLSDPDLENRLEDLRDLANDLAPDGFVSKLILPNSQILYIDVEAPGPDRPSRRNQIRSALVGRTPYEVDDLIFDWSRNGTWVKVAVVAKVTLEEAEAFADANGFHPVAFVAVPEEGSFTGEPYFGLASRAASHLPRGDRFDRDQDPVRVKTGPDSTDDARPAEAPPISALDEGEPLPSGPQISPDDAEADTGADTAPDRSVDGPAAEPIIALALANNEDAAPEDTPLQAVADEGRSATDADAAIDTPAEDIATKQLAEQEPEVLAVEDDDKSARLDAALAVGAAGPAGHVQDSVFEGDTSGPDYSHGPQITGFGDLADHDCNDGPAAGAGVFQSRRPPGPSGKEGRRVSGIVPRLGSLAEQVPDKGPKVGAALADAIRLNARATTAPDVARVRSSAPRMGAGDDRTTQDAAQAIPAARALPFGLRTVAAVVLAIGVVLLWVMWPSGPSETLGTPAGQAEIASPAPANTDLAAAKPATPDPQTTSETAPAIAPAASADTAAPAVDAPLPEATSEPAPAPSDIAADQVQPEPAAPNLPNPRASTTVSPMVATNGTETETAKGLAADNQPPVLPGLSLPDVSALATDSAPAAQPVPPSYGALLRYDANGSIIATPEGVVTPEGYTLFSGKPPRLPLERPQKFVVPQGSVSAADLAGKTPRPRPAGLAPAPPTPDSAATPDPAAPSLAPDPTAPVAPTDGAALPAVPADPQTAALPPVSPSVDSRHSARKPLSRPAGIMTAALAARQKAAQAAAAEQAAAEARQKALQSASKYAVASSRTPAERPKGLLAKAEAALAAANVDSASVQAALAEAQAPAPVAVAPEPQPAPQATASADPVDEPELQGGVPNMPTTRTVAKKATYANAIDLGKINLIGVYGSASSRRALVRMPSGRYVKVKIGDRLDGGQVAAIADSELSYVKNGKTYVLKILKNI